MKATVKNNALSNTGKLDRLETGSIDVLVPYRFDDFGVDGKLALVAESGIWAWVEPAISSFPSQGVIRVELLAESGTETYGIPKELFALIKENFTLDFPCNVFDDRQREQAVVKAKVFFDRFLSGDYRSFLADELSDPVKPLQTAGEAVKEAA